MKSILIILALLIISLVLFTYGVNELRAETVNDIEVVTVPNGVPMDSKTLQPAAGSLPADTVINH